MARGSKNGFEPIQSKGTYELVQRGTPTITKEYIVFNLRDKKTGKEIAVSQNDVNNIEILAKTLDICAAERKAYDEAPDGSRKLATAEEKLAHAVFAHFKTPRKVKVDQRVYTSGPRKGKGVVFTKGSMAGKKVMEITG